MSNIEKFKCKNLSGLGLLSLLAIAVSVSLQLMGSSSSACSLAEGTFEYFSQLNVVSGDGSGEYALTSKTSDQLGNPAWSPDGKKVAYDGQVFYSAGIYSGTNIFVIDTASGQQTQLTSSGKDSDPTWSADGTEIAFTSSRDGNSEIYLMDADGSNQTRLTDSQDSDVAPSFSPTERKLIFVSEQDASDELKNIDVDSLEQTTLLSGDGLSTPSFSQDGNKIAWAQSNDSGGSNIHVSDANGSNPVNLTDSGGLDDTSNPTWSVDSQKIAFVSVSNGNSCGPTYDIDTINVDGTDRQDIAPTAGQNSEPSWSKDDKIVYVSSTRTFTPTTTTTTTNNPTTTTNNVTTTGTNNPTTTTHNVTTKASLTLRVLSAKIKRKRGIRHYRLHARGTCESSTAFSRRISVILTATKSSNKRLRSIEVACKSGRWKTSSRGLMLPRTIARQGGYVRAEYAGGMTHSAAASPTRRLKPRS